MEELQTVTPQDKLRAIAAAVHHQVKGASACAAGPGPAGLIATEGQGRAGRPGDESRLSFQSLCTPMRLSLKRTFFPQLVDETRQHSAGHKEELRQCIVLQGTGGNGTMPILSWQLPCEPWPWGFADYSRKMWFLARSSNLPRGDGRLSAVPAKQWEREHPWDSAGSAGSCGPL